MKYSVMLDNLSDHQKECIVSILESCENMSNDYQSSEKHHPNHILVSREEFYKVCHNISSLDITLTSQD